MSTIMFFIYIIKIHFQIFVSERHVGQQEVKINSDIVFQTLTTTGTENPQRIIVASDGRRIAYLFSGSSDPQRCGILWNGSVPSLKDLRTSESTKIDDSFVIEMSTKRLLSVVLEKVVIVKIEETGESSVNGLEHITPMLHGDADEDVKKAPPQVEHKENSYPFFTLASISQISITINSFRQY